MAAQHSWLEGLTPRSVSGRRHRSGLRRTFAFALCSSLALASCDPETIDLFPLPPDTDQGGGGGGGNAGGGSAAAGVAGNKHTAGETIGGASAGVAGIAGSMSCVGLGCAGFNFGGFGGSIWSGNCNPDEETCALCSSDRHCPERWHCSEAVGVCVECEAPDDCRDGLACDLGIGRCSAACEDSIDCDE